MGDLKLPANGKHFGKGRMCTPLKIVTALTWTIHADRIGVWGSPLCLDLTPQHSNQVALHSFASR